MCYIQYCFFPSGGGVDDVLVRLPLIERITKDVNLMRISFSVKHPQIFWESLMSLMTYVFTTIGGKNISRKSR